MNPSSTSWTAPDARSNSSRRPHLLVTGLPLLNTTPFLNKSDDNDKPFDASSSVASLTDMDVIEEMRDLLELPNSSQLSKHIMHQKSSLKRWSTRMRIMVSLVVVIALYTLLSVMRRAESSLTITRTTGRTTKEAATSSQSQDNVGRKTTQQRFFSTSDVAPSSVDQRPIIYTFSFVNSDNGGSNSDEGQTHLDTWTGLWFAAGWDPRILTMKDARRHHHFNMFQNQLERTPSLSLSPSLPIVRLAYQWLAMAAVGGGFLADVNVYPLWELNDPQTHFRTWLIQGEHNLRNAMTSTQRLPYQGRATVFFSSDAFEHQPVEEAHHNLPHIQSASAFHWNKLVWTLHQCVKQTIVDHQDNLPSDENHPNMIGFLDKIFFESHDVVIPSVGKVLDGTQVLSWLLTNNDNTRSAHQWDERCQLAHPSVHFASVATPPREGAPSAVEAALLPMLWMSKWAERCLPQNSNYRSAILARSPNPAKIFGSEEGSSFSTSSLRNMILDHLNNGTAFDEANP